MATNVEKVSVAIGHEELAWARARAEREGTSLSAVLTTAARVARDVETEQARRDRAWAEFVDDATDGRGIDPEALIAAEAELDGR